MVHYGLYSLKCSFNKKRVLLNQIKSNQINFFRSNDIHKDGNIYVYIVSQGPSQVTYATSLGGPLFPLMCMEKSIFEFQQQQKKSHSTPCDNNNNNNN